MQKSVVVIPTYNSKRTIKKLVEKVLQYLPKIKIVVVDDSSPDGTANEIKKYFAKDRRITLIVKERKGGRGSAVIQGFQEGLKDKKVKFLIEMDSDLCHNPKYIPAMIKKCKEYDVVIASKYLKESKIIGLPFKRILFSKTVNLFIRFMLGIPITDYTNGFRCYKRKTLETLSFSQVRSKGFIVLSEIAFIIHKKKFLFSEMPFDFKFEDKNPSNLNFSEMREAFFTILRLKLSDLFIQLQELAVEK